MNNLEIFKDKILVPKCLGSGRLADLKTSGIIWPDIQEFPIKKRKSKKIFVAAYDLKGVLNLSEIYTGDLKKYCLFEDQVKSFIEEYPNMLTIKGSTCFLVNFGEYFKIIKSLQPRKGNIDLRVDDLDLRMRMIGVPNFVYCRFIFPQSI